MGGTTGRWWWVATGITLLVWALQISTGVSVVAWVAVCVAVFAGLGLATVVAALSLGRSDAPVVRPGPRTPAAFEAVGQWWQEQGRPLAVKVGPWVIAVAVVAAFVIWSFLQIRSDPSYSTDEVAFDQYAATLAMHGSNPYVHSMQPAFAMYHLSSNGATFRLDGTTVTSLSYPALSFELYIPFLALGWSTQMAVALNVAAWAIAILLLFGMLPRSVRPAALVVGSLSTYAGYAVGGITDALYVPFLLGAAYYWSRSLSGRGRAWWLSPLLLGLAMAIKQTPWLILPFAVLGIASEGRVQHGRWDLDAAARYLFVAVVAFAVPNLPYALGDPNAWAQGVLTPFLNHTVPAGQGLIGLSLFLHIGGGSLFAYTVTTLVAFAVLAAVYTASYPKLKGWTFVIPSLALFFAARSFGSYLVMLAPIAFLAAATAMANERAPEVAPLEAPSGVRRQQPWQRWPAVAAGGVLALAGSVTWALASAPPLTLSISTIRTTGQLATVERVVVAVRNNSGTALTPAFTVETGGVISSFWRVLGRHAPLRPGQQRSYTLLSPNEAAQPSVNGGFAVTAFTTGPDAVSSSNVFLPSTWHLALVPDSVNRPVPIGAPLVVHAQILDRLDRRVSVRGIPVYLGQVIYDQHGLINSSASVNGSPPGQTPVSVFSNADGVATFVIRGTQTTGNPVYFEANLVNFVQFYPYGYSNILLLRFGDSS